MAAIPATEISALRTVFASAAEGLLPQTATIYQRTLTADGEGGQAASWSTVRAANVACLVSREGSAVDVTEGGKVASPSLFRIRFLSNQTIAETDRIQVGTIVYAVVGTADVGGLAVLNRVIVRRII